MKKEKLIRVLYTIDKLYFSFWKFVLFIFLFGIVVKSIQIYDANIRTNLMNKYYVAMKENDSEKAIYYAKKLVKRKEKDKLGIRTLEGLCPDAELLLGYAYEASGDLDASLETFEKEKHSSFELYKILASARIAYKKGDFQEAFINFCAAVRRCNFNDNGSISSFERFREQLLFECYPQLKQLSPFADFGEFLSFMEEECAEVDNPQDYGSTIRLLYRLQLESEKRAQEKNRQSQSSAAFVRPTKRANFSCIVNYRLNVA